MEIILIYFKNKTKSLAIFCIIYHYAKRNANLSMALQSFVGPWPLFQFLNPIYSR
jgi:hypothetical protein